MAQGFEDYCWKDVVDDEMLEIYEAYHRKIYVGAKPAVLAIDLYNKAYQGGNRPVREVNRTHSGSCGENAWKAMEPTQKLFAAARHAGIPVVYTTRHVDTGGVASTFRQGKKLKSDTYDIKDELKPMPGELVIYKERASGFFGTPLSAHLRMMGIESLIICGESTSGCVRASTVDAYSHGFHCVLVEECTYDRSMLSHKVNLFDLHHKYADVMRVADVIAHLRMTKIDSLIICGESTSGCVRASTVDAYSYGFHNVVVEECTYDRSMLSHKVNLFDLHHKYADVMHVDEVIEHLEGIARGRNAA